MRRWDIVFTGLFVYGADNKPTWFTAAGYQQSSAPAGHVLFVGALQFIHSADNSLATVNIQVTSATQDGAPLTIPPGLLFTFTGTYTQSGHTGQVQGRFSITFPGEAPDTGNMNMFEIERTIRGISGRFNGADDSGGCRQTGRFAGVRR